MVSSIGTEENQAQEFELLAAWHKSMEKVGLSLDDLQRAIEDRMLRRGLIEIWHSDNVELPFNWQRSKVYRDWHELYPSQVTGRLATWYLRMKKMGLKPDDLQKAIKDSIFQKCLIDFWHHRSLSFLSPSQERAKEIMGRNMITIEEAVRCLDLNPKKDQLLALGQVPFTEELLRLCKDTYILVPVFPLSIYKIINSVPKVFSKRTLESKHYMFEEIGVPEWQLICKTIKPQSLEKTEEQQFSLLDDEEEVPSAITMVFAITVYYLITGERLFEDVIGRTSTVGNRGGPSPRLNVGPFHSDGLQVDEFTDRPHVWSFVGLFCAMQKDI